MIISMLTNPFFFSFNNLLACFKNSTHPAHVHSSKLSSPFVAPLAFPLSLHQHVAAVLGCSALPPPAE